MLPSRREVRFRSGAEVPLAFKDGIFIPQREKRGRIRFRHEKIINVSARFIDDYLDPAVIPVESLVPHSECGETRTLVSK